MRDDDEDERCCSFLLIACIMRMPHQIFHRVDIFKSVLRKTWLVFEPRHTTDRDKGVEIG